MTDEKQTEELTPFKLASKLYFDDAVPQQVKSFLDAACDKAMMRDLPAAMMIARQGEVMPRSQVGSMEELLSRALPAIDSMCGGHDKSLTMTIRDAANDIALSIDKAVSRVLLDDKYAKRRAYVKLIQSHALLTQALTGLALSTEEEDKQAAAS